ncbi:MAG: hypothetical protein U0800_17395 [Isosphaeraceae bacterium]
MSIPTDRDPEFSNPYQAPKVGIAPGKAFLDSTPDFRVDRNLLVVRKGAIFPDRCVRCNAPAEGYRLRRNLSWHHPLIYLVLLANLLIYVIVALAVRKTAQFDIPICRVHRAKRRNAILIAWGLVLASFPLGIGLGQVLPDDMVGLAFLAGFGLFLGGAIYGTAAAPPVVPAKIDSYDAWLKRVCPEFLMGLPEYEAPPRG